MMADPNIRRTAIAAALATLGCAVAAGAVSGVVAALLVLTCGAVTSALFLALTSTRQRRIALMAERVDEALHEGRTVSLSDMREGELAILASEVDKALTRLTITAEELTAEKASLADSLADISHQLRTPLTSLGLTLVFIRREATSGEQGHELLGRIRTCEQLLAQVQWLVEALLKLARLDAGTLPLRRAHVDVARLVEASASALAIPYELAGVAFERSIQDGCGFEGDEAWCREALGNVLKNCMEHTPAGGTVRVEATEDALACRITVTDTGPGIAEQDLPHVFERFYRGEGARTASGVNDGSTVANPPGIGVGLSLAQSLISAQDGRIVAGNVVNEKGQVRGARFDITFFKAVV